MVDSTSHFLKSGTFQKKNVILTGATGGIGSLVLKDLLACGANVLALVRDPKKLPPYLNDYTKTGQFNYEVIDLEVGPKFSSVMTSAMLKLKGKLDILILCHGSFQFGDINTISLADFDTNINVNVRANFSLLTLAVPFLKLTKGNVVMISGVESRIVEKDYFLHALTKTMINSMVQNAALELASFGVRVNAVAPSVTNTQLRVSEQLKEQDNMNYIAQMGGYSLLSNEVVQPQDVAEAILFLASDEAEFMTGEVMTVDNGFELNHDLTFKNHTY